MPSGKAGSRPNVPSIQRHTGNRPGERGTRFRQERSRARRRPSLHPLKHPQMPPSTSSHVWEDYYNSLGHHATPALATDARRSRPLRLQHPPCRGQRNRFLRPPSAPGPPQPCLARGRLVAESVAMTRHRIFLLSTFTASLATSFPSTIFQLLPTPTSVTNSAAFRVLAISVRQAALLPIV